jgi:hypothetical protein
MARLTTTCALLSAIALTACATAEPGTSASGAPDGSTTARAQDDATLTGSRLQRVQTDRMLKSVGNSSFRQDTTVHSLGNVVGATSN